MGKQIAIAVAFLFVTVVSWGQELTGRWTGRDTHELNGKSYTFQKEAVIQQKGNKFSGKVAVAEVGTPNYFVIQISGTLKNGKIKMFTDKVLKIHYPKTEWSILCFRSFRGDLVVNEAENRMDLNMESYGMDLQYDLLQKTYSDGNCHHTFSNLTKPYRTTEMPSELPSETVPVAVPKDAIRLSSKTVTVKVWDRYDEDGDRINIYLNGTLLFPNVAVTKKGEQLELTLLAGKNTIEVEAINEGTASPNTSTLRIFTAEAQHEIPMSARTGEKNTLHLVVE